MALSLSPQEIVRRDEYPLLRIAPSWERVRLGDIANVQNGFPFKSNLFSTESGFPLIRIRDVGRGETLHFYAGEYDNEFVVKRGDILIGMDGDFRAARWKGPDALLNQRVCRLTVESEHYDEDFFLTCLQPYLNAVNAETSSVTVKHLSSKTVQDIPLPLPPLNEQRRIVEKIEAMFDEIDKGVESLHTARTTLGLYRQSLLKSAFEGRLTADWRAKNVDKLEAPKTLLARIQHERDARHKAAFEAWQDALATWRADDEKGKKPTEPKRPDDVAPIEERELKELPSIPDAWAFSRLGLYIDWIEAGKSFKCLETEPRSDQVGVAKVSAVTWGEYNEHESKTCLDEDKINEAWFIGTGDFLLSRANTIELVGASVIAKKVTKRIMLSDKTLRIHFMPEDRRFFLYYLRSPYGRAEIEARSTGNQESMRNIGQDRIKSIIIPVCSEPEQAEIVRRLDARLEAAEALEAEIDAALTRANALRQSILKKAFSGQLVPQDPDDEPASALLERIKAHRAKAPKKTRKKAPA